MAFICLCTFKQKFAFFGEQFARSCLKEKTFFNFSSSWARFTPSRWSNVVCKTFCHRYRNPFTDKKSMWNIIPSASELIYCSDNKINELWALLAWNTISTVDLSSTRCVITTHRNLALLLFRFSVFSLLIIACRVAFSFHTFFTILEHDDLLIFNINDV